MAVTAGRGEGDLAEHLSAVVAAHAEVLRTYSAHSASSDLISQARGAITPSYTHPPVRVTQTASGTTIAVLVGVSGERAATAICHDIYEQVARSASAAGATAPIAISITIASIN
ncbi:hypothetical protein AWU67_06860 [Microterricola viridarii]|uniref:Uncharacterized protein n=1 Tax=Microterricola viridarii TaxID=412690 RepID=A0A109QXP7_9MICO|nr:hypothetical protein AWU67_06860 [Microterricola viridarii]